MKMKGPACSCGAVTHALLRDNWPTWECPACGRIDWLETRTIYNGVRCWECNGPILEHTSRLTGATWWACTSCGVTEDVGPPGGAAASA